MRYIPALGFDWLTPLFDPLVSLFGFGTRQRRHVVALLALRPGERLLDVGCGSGTQLLAARRQHSAVEAVGVDIDARILGIARRKAARTGLPVWLVRAGAQALPFPDGCFDVAVSTLTFHHLPTDAKRRVLQEVHRVLRPDGRFLVADFGPADSPSLRLFAWLVHAARLPEASTLADNVAGRLPGFLREAGFGWREVALRHRGIQFLLATKA